MAILKTENCVKVLAFFALFLTALTLYLIVLEPDISIDAREDEGRPGDSPRIRSTRALDDECTWNLTVNGTGGTLTSPDYPNNYPSNAYCRWFLATPDPDATLFLRINSLKVEPHTDCKMDYLQVYLGSSPLAPALESFCGTIHDMVLKTNSSKILLAFYSDDLYEEQGFSIDYFTQAPGDLGCPSLLTAESGFLQSPGFPNNYPDNTDCWTGIAAGPDMKIVLILNSIDLEYGDNCSLDYLQIFDGPTRNSTLLGQICRDTDPMGFRPTMSFQSSSNSLLVYFHSDPSVSKKGYRARYSFIDKNSTFIGDCIWEKDDNNGTIASPNYPANYPSLANCSLWIQVPDGHQVFITFEALQLEMETNCSYDYLLIKEGPPSDAKVLGTYCGRESEPKNLTTTQSEIQIQFHSDEFQEFSGFKLQYWFLENETVTETETEKIININSEISKLIFIRTPQNASLSEGSSYMLHCSTGHSNAKIRWLKGGRFLDWSNPPPGLMILPDNTLWIQSMSYHLAGIYSCKAISSDSVVMAKAYISIKDGQEDSYCDIVFRKTPKNSSFTEDEFAHLECLASETHIQLSWEKNGLPLQLQKHITVIKNGHIFMDRVKVEDAGVYSCVAIDAAANCTKKIYALLQVSKRAKIEEICGKPKMGQPVKDIPQMEDHGKIVGGNDTKKGAYPWQVMLWEPTLTQNPFCGASLLNERWIATAAHCFDNIRNIRWDRVEIKLGKHDRYYKEEHEISTAIAGQSSIVVHPLFNKETFDNDLALVKLRDPVRFTDYILPACLGDMELSESLLSEDESNNKIRMGWVIGWGQLTEDRHSSPRFLQEIKLPIVDQNTCRKSTKFPVSGNMFCAGYAQEIIGDACKGDSGGPYMMQHQDRWYMVGIVSWGEGCGRANKYGFYTRVPNYLSWIEGIIKS